MQGPSEGFELTLQIPSVSAIRQILPQVGQNLQCFLKVACNYYLNEELGFRNQTITFQTS